MNQPLHEALRITRQQWNPSHRTNPVGNTIMSTTIQRFTALMLAALALLIASAIPGEAGPVAGVKTSQHASFKPENFERLAVIVKPIQGQSHTGFVMGGRGRQQSQSQSERLVEQGFMRTLMAHGYTLVSRTDLDAAMVEKGLDQAKLTDEKLTEEAAKLLHVSSILIVSVDAFSVTPMQQQGSRPAALPGTSAARSGTQQTQRYFQMVASISARLVKIDDNMVMWTGDMTIDRMLATQEQDTLMLGSMAESIATAFPAFPAKKN